MQFWKISGLLLIFGGMIVSCGTSFHSAKYQKGFSYGEQSKRQVTSNVVNENLYSSNPSLNVQPSLFSDEIVQSIQIKDLVHVDSDQVEHKEFFSNEVMKEFTVTHQGVNSPLHEEVAIVPVDFDGGFDDEKAKRRYEQALFMFLPYGILLGLAALFVFIPNAIIGMVVSLSLALVVLIVMITLAGQARQLTSDERLRKNAKGLQIAGRILLISLFLLGTLGAFLALQLGTISIF